MKFVTALGLVFGLGVVTANPLVQKRASASEAASLGYATLSGGTTGGGSATPVTVTTLDELKTAVTGSTAKVVIISGSITGNEVVKVGSNTSVLGKSGATLNGVGLRVLDVSNVIIRNVKINKVLASAGDAIGVQAANRVWVDSVELWSDRDHDKDYYDGLLDITHGCYAVTVTNSYLHDHWKASLVGHSDNNESEDLAIQVTYAFNKWYNLNSRTPSFRFGHGHIFNNYYLSNGDGINTRVGAELLVQNNVFEDCKKPLYTTDNGYANASGNDFGGVDSTALTTTWDAVGYTYTLKSASDVKDYVNSNAGANLDF
ncbi:Pectate lyase [Ceratobasidium theobromae]|uniref:Pectate lyase n=1 Tax=Ceratobasidium theobromae TaxID=1582974 RepID=A0A5N5QRE7_9AGAM|nr:Pectate lyase [Ceratobasidium theobromae]